jgi:D-aspartate ligase
MDVIIIGGFHHNTLGVLRSIGAHLSPEHIDVIAIGEAPQKNLLSQSKYIPRHKVNIVKNENEITSWLLDKAKDGNKRVLISCSDGASAEIISHRYELQDHYLMPYTKVDIMDLMSKEVQNEYAIKSGLQVPEGIILQKGEKTNWNIFPCIIKPLKSIIGAGKADIHVVHSSEELEGVLSSIEADTIQI